MTKLLQERVVLVTGGAKGVGWAIAHTFAEEGASLFLVGREAEALEQARDQLTREGFSAEVAAADITQEDGPEHVIEATVQAFGRIDVLVNCAAMFIWRPFLRLTPKEWHDTLELNLTAPFLLSHAAAQRFIQQGSGGSILNITSVHGAVADPHLVPQCASKAGLEGLTRATAEALRAYGIRVNAISPGAVAPNSSEVLSGDLKNKITQGDVAQLAVFLSSDRARGVTGAVLDAYGITRPVVAAAPDELS